MPKLLALAVSVGLLAVAATWLFGLHEATVYKLQVWQAFIAWGCHYQSGGKFAGSRNTAICMSFGAVVGMGAVMLIPHLDQLGALAGPVAVGIGATLIVLASAIPFLATIPASVYGFAAIAGLILLGTGVSPTAALAPTVVSILIGTVFGYVSEAVAGALSKKAPQPAPAAA